MFKVSSYNGYAICAMPRCKFKFSDGRQYYEHLCSVHQFPQMSLLETYAFAYFLVDTAIDRSQFSDFCCICQKNSNYVQQSTKTHSSKNATTHIYTHMGVPKLQCSICETWFSSSYDADKHSADIHSGTNSIISIEKYFENDYIGLSQWLSATNELTKQLNLAIESQYNLSPKPSYLKKSIEDISFIKRIELCESQLCSLKAFHGMHSKTFRLIGDWGLLGRMIQSSSSINIKICCQEIKDELAELITHRRACHSMAGLLVRCDNQFWNHFLTILNNSDFKQQIYRSQDAATFFRKLLTAVKLQNGRFLNLSFAFANNNWIDPDLIESPYFGIFLLSIAAHPGPAAIGFCKYAMTKIVELSCGIHLHTGIRMLIKTSSIALKIEYNNVYEQFLKTTVAVIPSIIDSVYGQLVIQCLLYFAPSFCSDHIKTFVSLEWIFSKPTNTNQYFFDIAGYSVIAQTAIEASDSTVSAKLTTQLLKNDYCKLLFCSPIGNNIIRRIVNKLSNLQLLDQLCDKLSVQYTCLTRQFGHSHKSLRYSKCCLDLAIKQRNIVRYES